MSRPPKRKRPAPATTGTDRQKKQTRCFDAADRGANVKIECGIAAQVIAARIGVVNILPHALRKLGAAMVGTAEGRTIVLYSASGWRAITTESRATLAGIGADLFPEGFAVEMEGDQWN